MKIIFNSLLIVIAAAIGLGLGIALRGKSPNRSNTAATQPAVAASQAVARTQTVSVDVKGIATRPNDDSPLATKLERDLSMSRGVTRWLYWLEALEKATPADFPRLARLANGNSVATRFVAARWVELDPRHLFDTLISSSATRSGFPWNELSSVLFEEWPKRDTEAVIAALNEGNDFGQRKGQRREWRRQLASSVIEKDPERGLQLMSQWNIENYGPRVTGVAKWAAADPRHAAEFALQHPAGYASRLVMEAIGKEWAKTDPARALEFAAGNPGELGNVLATSVLKDWAARDLYEAGEWLSSTETRTRNRFSPTFLEAWAKQDAASALSWCESNLSGSSLADAVAGVLKGAASKDVGSAAGLVADMSASSARAEAAVAVARKWFPEFSADKPVKPETLAWLRGLDSDSVKRVLEEVHWRWSEADPKSMAEFLTTATSEQIPSHACSSLVRNMARKNPAGALEWANRLPADRAVSVGSDAFAEWRRTQPEQAMGWFNELPATDARHKPFLQSVLRDLAFDSRAAEQLAMMSPTDRSAARNLIPAMGIPEDRRSRLLTLLQP